jgi:hypothetical protein
VLQVDDAINLACPRKREELYILKLNVHLFGLKNLWSNTLFVGTQLVVICSLMEVLFVSPTML